MGGKSEGTSWFGSMYNKLECEFEDFCLEMNGVLRQQRQEIEYVENKLQTVGASVKQFCSDFVHEILPHSSESLQQGAAHKSSLAQNNGEASKSSKEGIVEGPWEGPCNMNDLRHPLPQNPENVARHYSYSSVQDREDTYEGSQLKFEVSDDMSADDKHSILSVPSGISDNLLRDRSHEEEHLQLEIPDIFTLDKEGANLSAWSPTSADLLQSSHGKMEVPSAISSSDSVTWAHFSGGKVLDLNDVCGNAPAELHGKSDNPLDDMTNVGSSHNLELDERCITVNGKPLYSYKEKFRVSIEKEQAVTKQDDTVRLDCRSCEEEEEGEGEGEALVFSDVEYCESEWEII